MQGLSSASSKASVAFIMNSSENVLTNDQEASLMTHGKARQTRSSASDDKRKNRECKVDGCENYIINKGLCFRHGVHMRLDNCGGDSPHGVTCPGWQEMLRRRLHVECQERGAVLAPRYGSALVCCVHQD
ncbi:hypothetical protein ON010_g15174 [Phytophthora cinnamomi]|nr:hypothetical protein ON010_g15174 [Phytophthora cinnamomi]